MTPTASGPLLPSSHPVITSESVFVRSQYFIDVQLWSFSQHFDPNRWLANFEQDEQEHALHLLNSFLYFPKWMVDKLFLAAFQALSRNVITTRSSFLSARGEWRRFVNTALVVRVTGENPNDADSGFIFARSARDNVGIPEENVVRHEDALAALLKDPTTPIVFVDDFVGSGQQFIKTWKRKYNVPGHVAPLSFEDVSIVSRAQSLFYCSVLCTELGKSTIKEACQRVHLSPAHLLTAQYNLLNPNCLFWPDHLRPTASDFLRRCSTRAGIPECGGGEGDWRGFHCLGLAVAFEHGIPDATLPLFTWDKNGWAPLLRSKT